MTLHPKVASSPCLCAVTALLVLSALSSLLAPGTQHNARAKAPEAKSTSANRASRGTRTPKPASAAIPADRDAAVVAVTRNVLTQILKGKVESSLLTPTMRAKLTPAKVRSMQASFREFGGLKTVKLVDRKERGEGTEVCTLRVVLGETTFIATVAVMKDNKLDDLQLLEE